MDGAFVRNCCKQRRCTVKRSRIHILGASGSGTTTLARALADHWAVPHADADDYFWIPTDPPFREKRQEPERVALMRDVFVPREAWVLSGSMMGWGEAIVRECDAVIFVTLDPDERMRRLRQREEHRRAGRGEFDESAWQAFLTWAGGYDDPAFEGRSRVSHEKWLATVEKPVLRLDSAQPVGSLVSAVLAWDPARPTSSFR